jgi:hypothetical protein
MSEFLFCSIPPDGQFCGVGEHGSRSEHGHAWSGGMRHARLQAHAVPLGSAAEEAGPLHASTGRPSCRAASPPLARL